MQGPESPRPAHCLHTCRASPMTNIPHHHGPCVPTDELALTHHHHPKSIVNSVVHSVHLDRHIIQWVHHYGITQSSFNALKIPCSIFFDLPKLIGQKICRLWDHPMSSNIISRNHVRVLLLNYKKQVSV